MKALSLQIAAVLVTVVFGIPLTVAPLKWARVIGWTLPDDVKLTRYFGRCLGCLVLVLVALALYASTHPAILPLALALTSMAMLLMVVVHIVGALEKAQPPFETAEIGMYLLGGLYFGWLALS
jgi:hypothetical protein